MVSTVELPASFPHTAPTGYEYRTLSFKRNIISIWIVHRAGFDYNHHCPVHCIWGFYDAKKQVYYSPINSSKCGNTVDLKFTSPYSAMPLHLNPLTNVLYS